MEVKVNVYDIATKVNRYVSWMGLGAYHTGVQIGSREYTFSNGGVVYHTPLDAGEEAIYKETIDMGEVDALVRKLVGKGIPSYINRAAKLGAGFGPKDVTESSDKKKKANKGKNKDEKASTARPQLTEAQRAKLAKIKGPANGAKANAKASASAELDAEDENEDDV
ncbi:Desumoylating isopeptidase 2 [Hondaea fermentalgiana]|uniref:Desumoylating isopeptidase 2 n=1 Tax=Hondaea fermentalgiana TaxID=2315210 RepID=A0A2R5GJP6_9STRA|nr:Desumoylating isopeptidase 2 [Hondaea fermentalgiana]|eukprot:GBG31116.1 Desumoylating isopeptidase 2 [Hondaea fermentalgiana]